MGRISISQRIVMMLIKIIESIVNSSILLAFLNSLSNRVYKYLKNSKNLQPGNSTLFKGLRIAFIADGNRRYCKKIKLTTKKDDNQVIAASDAQAVVHSRSFLETPQDSICLPDKHSHSFCNSPSPYSNAEADFLNIRMRAIESDKNKKQLLKKSHEKFNNHKMKHGLLKILELIKFAFVHKFEEISFYCFSIKNFQRKKEEVDDIMNIIKEQHDLDFEVPIKVLVHGRLELLDKDARETLNNWVERTANNTGMIVNFFFSYSSSDEAENGVTFKSPVDLLIRTSDVKRLSDFMVNQVAHGTAVDFVKPLWPEYTLIHLWLTLIKYKLEEKYLK